MSDPLHERLNKILPRVISDEFLSGSGIGNEIAAQIRLRGGKRLESPALIVDGNHARIDGFVSLGVIASAVAVGLGAPIADPIIGLVITAVILRITWDSWQTIYGGHAH